MKLQAAAKAGIPESLFPSKDEYEAYWEHYIAVKEELVEKVLQDDLDGDESSLLGPLVADPKARGKAARGMTRWYLFRSLDMDDAVTCEVCMDCCPLVCPPSQRGKKVAPAGPFRY